jgi:hypothetical protein
VPLPDNLPSGEYQILMGFYRPSDFTRLSVTGTAYPDAVGISVHLN